MYLIRKTVVILSLMGAFAGGCANEPETPACSNPARLEGHPNPKVPGVFIGFKPTAERNAAAGLAQKYQFSIANQYPWNSIVTTDLDLMLIPSVRCERDVDYVEFNQEISI